MATKNTISHVNSVLNEDSIDFKTIPELLKEHAYHTPEKEAFVFLSTERERETITWKEVFEKSQELAKSIVQLGVKPKEIVAISYRTCPSWIYTNFGIIMAGAIPVSLSFTYENGSDVIAIMKLLKTCSAIFIDPGQNDATWNIFRKLVDTFNSEGYLNSSQMPHLRYLVCLFKPKEETNVLTSEELFHWSKSETSLPKIHVDDIMGLFQTSGSTGDPKVIAHTHRYYNYLGISSVYLQSGPEEINYNDRPFGWIGGYPENMYLGETRVTRSGMCDPPESNIDYLFRSILQERCTNTVLFPAHIEEMSQRQVPENWPLKTLYTGGQPVSKKTAKCLDMGLCEWFGVAYGSSETSLCLCNLVNKSDDFVEHSCGKPIPGIEVKIVDKNGDVASAYSRGELYIRTKAMFAGYYNDPERTKTVVTEDGWYKTDDVAFMTDDGIFYIEGRKSDIIISGAMNVLPAILEAILKTCPGVKDVMLVPVPHETLYQEICACFMAEPGSTITEDRLRQFCEAKHADKPRLFTVLPHYYLAFDDFPKAISGKSSRKLLISEAIRRLATHY